MCRPIFLTINEDKMTNGTYKKIVALLEKEGITKFALTIAEIEGINLNVTLKTNNFPIRDLAILRQESSKLIYALYEEETASDKKPVKEDKVASATKNMLE